MKANICYGQVVWLECCCWRITLMICGCRESLKLDFLTVQTFEMKILTVEIFNSMIRFFVDVWCEKLNTIYAVRDVALGNLCDSLFYWPLIMSHDHDRTFYDSCWWSFFRFRWIRMNDIWRDEHFVDGVRICMNLTADTCMMLYQTGFIKSGQI